MGSSLLHISLQAPGSVSSAQHVPGSAALGQDRLLILHDTHITACSVNRQGLEQQQTWRASASIARLVYLPSGHLLMATESGHCTLHRVAAAADAVPQLIDHAVLQPAQDGLSNDRQPFGTLVSDTLSAHSAGGVASLLVVAHQTSVLHVVRVAPTVGGLLSLDIKAIPHKQVLVRCMFPDISSSPLLSVRIHSRILGLLWLSPAEQQLEVHGNSLLAVLHEFSPTSQPPILHVDCVAVDWQEGSMSPGPWALRNVHPTTQLLQSFPGHGQLPAGVMIISSRGVILCSCLPAAADEAGSSTAAAVPVGVDVQQKQLVQWSLQGVPLSCAAVAANRYVVGDDRAGLHILNIRESGQSSWQQVATAASVSVPHVLVHIPFTSKGDKPSSSGRESMDLDSPQQHQHAADPQLSGLLFIGSRSSSSQVLGLPVAADSTGLPTSQQETDLSCLMLQSAFLPSLAGAQAVCALKDSTGALPEQQLLVACGADPNGKLAVVRSGMGITPFTLDGPQLPGDAVLFPIEDHPQCNHQQHQQPASSQPGPQPHHDLLCFSFPSANMTEVLSLVGSTFRQLAVPGVQQDQPALLMAGLPGGWLLQVTSAAVLVIDKHSGNGVLHSWIPDGSPISLAAVSGSQLALACGNRLTALAVDCCTGALQHVGNCQLPQQASALAVCKLSGGATVIAVGLWMVNQLLLLSWPATGGGLQQLVVGCVADLEEDQARSAAIMPVGSDDLLLVGTNSGTVLIWQVVTAAAAAVPSQQQQGTCSSPSFTQWMLVAARKVQISSTSIALHPVLLPDSSNSSNSSRFGARLGVYAHAGGGVVFSPADDMVQIRQMLPQQHRSISSSAGNGPDVAVTDCVRVSRVCGTEGTPTAAVIHTIDMPHSLAWVSAANSSLCFGGLDSRHKLRWGSKSLQGTPLGLTAHTATHTIVLLLQADAGTGRLPQQQLLLLDGRSLSVLAAVALAPGHSYTTLAVLDLPCTLQHDKQLSSTAAAGGNQVDTQLGCMPFILLGTRVSLDVASTGSDAFVLPPSAASGTSTAVGRDDAMPFARTAHQPGTAGSAAAGKAGGKSIASEVGMLSIFELKFTLLGAAGTFPGSVNGSAGRAHGGTASTAGSELRYELVLHGLSPLSSIPASLCTVVPAQLMVSTQQEQQEPARKAAKQQCAGETSKSPAAAAAGRPDDKNLSRPYLCVGSEAGVALYDVNIDNAGTWAAARIQDVLAQAVQVSSVNLDAASGPPECKAAQQQRQQSDQLRVSLVHMSSSEVLSGGVVVSLRSSGSSVIALEALGSVTVLRALSVGQDRVQLLPVGADRTGLMAMDVAVAQTAAPAPAASSAAVTVGEAQGGSAVQAGCQSAAVGDVSATASHQALLLAMHPEGLLLLQRDLAAEQQHQQLAREAAVGMYEAGLMPDDLLVWQQQQQEMLQGAVQPWLGAGEAAPWAAAGVQGRPQAHHLQLEAAGPAAQRAGLAPTAAVAGGAAAIGVVNPGAEEAPRLLPSAACASAPGTSIMVAAGLGLHVQLMHDGAGGNSSSSGASPLRSAEPLWCFSPSGAVSVVQLLQAAEARPLLQMQKQLMQLQHSSQKQQVVQVQPGSWDGQLLWQLRKLGLSASYRNYRHSRSNRAGLGADQQDAEEELPFNCVDGDLLFATRNGSKQHSDTQQLQAGLLQHWLWQAIM